ncbi:MAG: metallophosphoesterase [Planctomyces sp.]|nr:metallophosphoesterase [Planctomyces sp.]
MFDLIGDIHGHADELILLLESMGYNQRHGVFRHPDRRVVFCGDFIDRGPQIAEVIAIVRNMMDAGEAMAVMGNHEYNAIAFHTEHPENRGHYLRSHSTRNVHQHQATLNQLTTSQLQDALRWFASLPIALDPGAFRVVHACWDFDCIRLIEDRVAYYGGLTPHFLVQSSDPDQPLFEAIERVLKGPELRLPDGLSVRDKEGAERRQIRIRWFESPKDHTLSSYALPEASHEQLRTLPVTGRFRPALYGADEVPLFVGHYWMTGTPHEPLTSNIACLDYSVAKNGHLCAYRFDGERVLSSNKFVSVPGTVRIHA